MAVTSLPQFGPMIGASIAVDGIAFDDSAHAGPRTVDYDGPEQWRAVSGRPYLQGPVTWTCKWDAMTLDDFQALYTVWNLLLNSNSGPRVVFSVNDPRTAGGYEGYDCWMDEPQFEMADLYVRGVEARFVSVIE
jgi:hypothetical protein